MIGTAIAPSLLIANTEITTSGQRPGDAFGPTLEEGVPRLLDAARERAAAL